MLVRALAFGGKTNLPADLSVLDSFKVRSAIAARAYKGLYRTALYGEGLCHFNDFR